MLLVAPVRDAERLPEDEEDEAGVPPHVEDIAGDQEKQIPRFSRKKMGKEKNQRTKDPEFQGIKEHCEVV